jgi:hypothetical protein
MHFANIVICLSTFLLVAAEDPYDNKNWLLDKDGDKDKFLSETEVNEKVEVNVKAARNVENNLNLWSGD